MIRKILIPILGVLLVISLTVTAISWDLSESLQYNNIQNQVVNIAGKIITQNVNLTDQINKNRILIEEYCKSNSDFIFSQQGLTFNVSCKDMNKSPSEIVNQTIKNFIKDLYYKQYNCNYWDCLNSSNLPTFLISKKSQIYWKNIFTYSLGASLLLITALFFLFEKKSNLSLTVGTLTIFTALPLLGIQKILSIFPKTISQITSIFFSQSNYVFIRMMLIGGGILLIGIIIKLFETGFNIYNLFSRHQEQENTSQEPKTKQPDTDNKSSKISQVTKEKETPVKSQESKSSKTKNAKSNKK